MSVRAYTGCMASKSGDIAGIAEVSFVSSLGYLCIGELLWDMCPYTPPVILFVVCFFYCFF